MSGYHHRDDIDEAPEDRDIADGASDSRSTRSTNYYHRNSSSLTPIQMMTQEICYNTAENFLWYSIIIARQIVCLLVIDNQLNTTLSEYHHLAMETRLEGQNQEDCQEVTRNTEMDTSALKACSSLCRRFVCYYSMLPSFQTKAFKKAA
jgi:hypothetical protein